MRPVLEISPLHWRAEMSDNWRIAASSDSSPDPVDRSIDPFWLLLTVDILVEPVDCN